MAPTSLMNLVTKTLSNKELIHAAYDRMRKENEEKNKRKSQEEKNNTNNSDSKSKNQQQQHGSSTNLEFGDQMSFGDGSDLKLEGNIINSLMSNESNKKVMKKKSNNTPMSTPEPSAKKILLKTISEKSDQNLSDSLT